MNKFGSVAWATAIAVVVGFSSPASAANWLFDADDLLAGATPQIVNLGAVNGNTSGPTVTVTSGSNLSFKNAGSTVAIGTQSGVNGEIDTGPSVFMTFDQTVSLTEMTIAWLFPNGQYGDSGNEVASFRTYDAGGLFLNEFTLEATGFEDALFSGIGDVANLSPAQSPLFGIWKITGLDIFGAFSILELSGSVINNQTGNSSGADFSFVSARGASVVPVPAALPLMLLGIGAFGLVAKRRRSAQA